jgi:hypothetical protein
MERSNSSKVGDTSVNYYQKVEIVGGNTVLTAETLKNVND